jgi:hypothetical protein
VPTDAAAGRFRLRRAVCAWLRVAAGSRPLAIVLDDLHNADAETLVLLAGVAEELPAAPVLAVAAFRPTDADDRLEETLAVLARRAPHRVALAGLSPPEVGELVRAVHQQPLDPATLAALAERTGGNPFYVWESVRLLASEGALVATSEVPEGVRDVLRRRLARLPPAAVSVLRLAAVVGRDADVEVLVRAAGTGEAAVLDALEAGLIAGLLTEPAPGRVRFAHVLARDTLYGDLPRLRRGRLHARVAAAVEELHPEDFPALGPPPPPGRVAGHRRQGGRLRRAGGRGGRASLRPRHRRRPAHPGAGQPAAGPRRPRPARRRPCRRAGRPVRAAVARAGAGGSGGGRAVDPRAGGRPGRVGRPRGPARRCVHRLDRADAVISRPYGMVDERTVGVLLRLLRRTDLDPAARCRLLGALSFELAGEGDPRAAEAAREAVALARDLADPALLALAVAAEAWEASWDREPERRAHLAAEIGRIGGEHDLAAYRWCAEHIAATAAAAGNDPRALRDHVERGLELARAYQMPEPLSVGRCTEAMLAHVAGRFDESERRYAEACAQMARHGSLHADGIAALAAVTIRASQHRMAEYAPAVQELDARFGPLAVDARAVALAAAGRLEEAGAVLDGAPPLRPDFFFSVFATLRAMAVVAVGQRQPAEELYAALLPVRGQLAGAASTSLAMRPVAHTLAELARLLGRHGAVAEHLDEAVAVARAWEAPR